MKEGDREEIEGWKIDQWRVLEKDGDCIFAER